MKNKRNKLVKGLVEWREKEVKVYDQKIYRKNEISSKGNTYYIVAVKT